MKPILCPVDFSESSFSVLKKAFEIAAHHETILTVLFPYRLKQPSGISITEYKNSVEEMARKNFEKIISRLEINGSIKYEFRIEIGFLIDRILNYVEKNEIELVVIGHDLVNSIDDSEGQPFQNLMASIKIPLLIVPKEEMSV